MTAAALAFAGRDVTLAVDTHRTGRRHAMRLGRIASPDGPRLAAYVEGTWHDLTAATEILRCDPVTGWVTKRTMIETALGSASKVVEDPEVLCPIAEPARIFCIGLNYRDHAAETNSPIPEEPIVFSKFASALHSPGKPIVLPKVSDRVDYEAELAVVIGRPGKNVGEADALSHVAGYACANDVSARDWQKGKPGKQWLLGKTFDTFCPIGPYLVTADEVPDPHSLSVTTTVSGEVMQDGSTSDLIFDVPKIVSYISGVVGLRKGDVILTGTPAGVGDARTPPRYLKDGDTVEVRIGDLGPLSNPVVAEA